MRRGEVHLYVIASHDKRRPMLLPTRESMVRRPNEIKGITVAPITTTIRNPDSEI